MSTSGFLYFAYLRPLLTKVGRFKASLSVAEKEAQYRTLNPEFRIMRAYFSNDVVKEEKRVLTQLRLVGGTAVTGAGRETFKLSVVDAVKLAKVPSLAAQEDMARQILYSRKLSDGCTIKHWLDILNAQHASSRPYTQADAARESKVAMELLLSLGILLSNSHEALELTSALFCRIRDEKKCLAAMPELKFAAPFMDTLTF